MKQTLELVKINRGSKRMDFIVEAYKRAHPKQGPDVSPDAVADWAVTQPDLWRPIAVSPRDQLRRLIARSLREKYMLDPQGREVRANHPVFRDEVTRDGIKRCAHYYPLFDSPATIARSFFSWRRKAALADVMQLNIDFDSWLDNNKFGETIDRPDFNFNLDIEESKQPTEYLDQEEGGED